MAIVRKKMEVYGMDKIKVNFLVDIINDCADSLEKMDKKIVDSNKDYAMECWTKENFVRAKRGKWKHSLIILHNDEPVGFLVASLDSDKKLHINRFAVAVEYQNRGYGTILLEQLEKTLVGTPIETITLFVNKNNDEAITFYKKLGFEVVEGAKLLTELFDTGRTYNENLSLYAKICRKR